nr:hypothetical protein [Rhodovulum sulfidophilum]
MISAELSKIDGQGSDQSMQSAALRHGSSLPLRTAGLAGSPWVGAGQAMGRPSRRATQNQRLRIVGAP